nr:phospholipase-like protein [Tanacetum cinerariifolium]
MYQIDNRTTQTRAPQSPQTFRNTNPRLSTSTRVNHKTNVSRPQLRSNQMKDKVVPNNSQVKIKKTQVEDHLRIPSISNKNKSVSACNDSLNSRILNANAVCATCGKCLVDSDHFSCVIKMLNDVNAKTKKPNVVPISTRKPKGHANKSVATPHKKKVALKSTTQTPNSYYRMLYEKTSKAWKWWIYNNAHQDINGFLKQKCNGSELGLHDHINEQSSSKLVPKVVPPASKTATSRQEFKLLFHHYITMLRNGDIPFRNRLFPDKIGYDVKIIDLFALFYDEEKFSKLSYEDAIRLCLLLSLEIWIIESSCVSDRWWTKVPEIIPRALSWRRKAEFTQYGYFGELFCKAQIGLAPTKNEVQCNWYAPSNDYFMCPHHRMSSTSKIKHLTNRLCNLSQTGEEKGDCEHYKYTYSSKQEDQIIREAGLNKIAKEDKKRKYLGHINSYTYMKLAIEHCVAKKRKYVDVLRSSFCELPKISNVPSIEQLANQKNVVNPLMIEKCKSVKPWIEDLSRPFKRIDRTFLSHELQVFLSRAVVGRCKFLWCNDITVDRSFWNGLCAFDDNRKGWLLDETDMDWAMMMDCLKEKIHVVLKGTGVFEKTNIDPAKYKISFKVADGVPKQGGVFVDCVVFLCSSPYDLIRYVFFGLPAVRKYMFGGLTTCKPSGLTQDDGSPTGYTKSWVYLKVVIYDKCMHEKLNLLGVLFDDHPPGKVYHTLFRVHSNERSFAFDPSLYE